MEFKYCPGCGDPLQKKEHSGKRRMFCRSCDIIHYRNPTVGVAIILMWEGNILLVKRAGSYKDMWCIPCGHVEWDEDIRLAGIREFKEETNLDIKLGPVFTAHSNFHDGSKQTVGVWFWASNPVGILKPGSDASEAEYFPLDTLPTAMAFPTDLLVCKQLSRGLATGSLPR
jgi:8-oxo-dGTP diphosphatase